MPPSAPPTGYAPGTPITVDGRGTRAGTRARTTAGSGARSRARTGAGIAAGTVDRARLSGRYRR